MFSTIDPRIPRASSKWIILRALFIYHPCVFQFKHLGAKLLHYSQNLSAKWIPLLAAVPGHCPSLLCLPYIYLNGWQNLLCHWEGSLYCSGVSFSQFYELELSVAARSILKKTANKLNFTTISCIFQTLLGSFPVSWEATGTFFWHLHTLNLSAKSPVPSCLRSFFSVSQFNFWHCVCLWWLVRRSAGYLRSTGTLAVWVSELIHSLMKYPWWHSVCPSIWPKL